MTTEQLKNEDLTKAAQQALEALRNAQQLEHLVDRKMQRAAIAALEHALTTSQSAQEVDEREEFEAWFDDYYNKACAEFGGIDCTDPKGIAEDAWQARASLPAPQQGIASNNPTHEVVHPAECTPVGEVFYACPDELEMLRQRTVKHCLLSTFKAHGGKDVTLYTHPAPGVPEGFALVSMTDEQLCDALGIDGSDDWTYTVRDAVEAHHAARLAAATSVASQAKGGSDDSIE